MEGRPICSNFIDPDLFFRFLIRRFHGSQFWAKLTNSPSFNLLAFRNGFEYRNFNLHTSSGNIVTNTIYTLCKFNQDRSSNPRDYEDLFRQDGKNRRAPNISTSTGQIVTKFISLVDMCMGIIKLTYISR